MPPVYELRLPIRIDAFVCARIGGAASVDTSAAPAPAELFMNVRRDRRRTRALIFFMVALPRPHGHAGGRRQSRRDRPRSPGGVYARLPLPACRLMIEGRSRKCAITSRGKRAK